MRHALIARGAMVVAGCSAARRTERVAVPDGPLAESNSASRSWMPCTSRLWPRSRIWLRDLRERSRRALRACVPRGGDAGGGGTRPSGESSPYVILSRGLRCSLPAGPRWRAVQPTRRDAWGDARAASHAHVRRGILPCLQQLNHTGMNRRTQPFVDGPAAAAAHVPAAPWPRARGPAKPVDQPCRTRIGLSLIEFLGHWMS